MIDTHCHLSMVIDNAKNIDYNKIDEILDSMRQSGVTHAITIGSNFEDSAISCEIADRYGNIYCAVGVHPEEIADFDCNRLENLINENLGKKLVAIGEIGLDYYWRKDNKQEQIEVFKQQIELAKKYNLPIVVHCREAYGDCLEVLKQYYSAGDKRSGVIHCYAGSIEWAKEVIKLGFYISFTGVVTYNNAKNVQEVAKWVELDKFMVETDSPYLTPVPFRGKENNPSFVKYTLEYIADLKTLDPQTVDKQTTENAVKLFELTSI